jgi:hypothetical protein
MSSYEEQAASALSVVMEDAVDKSDLHRVLDAMSTDDLHALYAHADLLSVRARREWLHRTKRPGRDV